MKNIWQSKDKIVYFIAQEIKNIKNANTIKDEKIFDMICIFVVFYV